MLFSSIIDYLLCNRGVPHHSFYLQFYFPFLLMILYLTLSSIHSYITARPFITNYYFQFEGPEHQKFANAKKVKFEQLISYLFSNFQYGQNRNIFSSSSFSLYNLHNYHIFENTQLKYVFVRNIFWCFFFLWSSLEGSYCFTY